MLDRILLDINHDFLHAPIYNYFRILVQATYIQTCFSPLFIPLHSIFWHNICRGGEFYEPYKKQIPYLNFGYAMWYLWALFVYYLITPYLLRHFQLKTILIVSFFIALIVGIIPYINMTFQFSRVICFYPFFLLGVILKEKYESYIYTFTQRKKAVFVMSICILIYVIAQTSFPGIVFATGFTNGYGLHLSGLIFRLFTQIMCIIMSLSMILIIPNKQFWFTRYGSKTMNVYLLQ